MIVMSRARLECGSCEDPGRAEGRGGALLQAERAGQRRDAVLHVFSAGTSARRSAGWCGPRRPASGRCAGGGQPCWRAGLAGGACQPGHQLARRAGTQQRLAGRDRADRAGQIGTADFTAVPAKVLDRAARRARAARAGGLARQAFRPCKGVEGNAALDLLLAGGHHLARRVSTSTSAVSPSDEDPVSRRDQAGRDRHICSGRDCHFKDRSVHRTRRDTLISRRAHDPRRRRAASLPGLRSRQARRPSRPGLAATGVRAASGRKLSPSWCARRGRDARSGGMTAEGATGGVCRYGARRITVGSCSSAGLCCRRSIFIQRMSGASWRCGIQMSLSA